MKRTYDQYCGLARALDVVGERWTLLIVRDLALGPQRYSDLLAGLPGIGTALLAERLRHLEGEGIARRATLPPPANVAVWDLTDEGRALALATGPLAMWGARRLGRRAKGQLYRADWLLLTLWANFKAEAAVGVLDTYEFVVEGDRVHVRIEDGTMEVRRGPAPVRPDLRVTTDIETLVELGVGRLDPADAVATGRADVEGDDDVLERCVSILGPSSPVAARRRGKAARRRAVRQ